MDLKTFKECLDWMEEVVKYRNSAPEGMCATVRGNDMFPTLRNVDPKAITQLSTSFPLLETLSSFNGERKVQLEGSEEGYFYTCTILWLPGHDKLPKKGFKFLYRQTTSHGPDTV